MGVLGTMMLGGPVLAQVAVIEADPKPAPNPFDVELGYRYQSNTDLKKSSGDFHRNDFQARLNAEIFFSDKVKPDNILSYAYHHYSFSGTSPFQWDSVNRFMYAPLFKWQTSEQWTLLAAPIVQWMGESGAWENLHLLYESAGRQRSFLIPPQSRQLQTFESGGVTDSPYRVCLFPTARKDDHEERETQQQKSRGRNHVYLPFDATQVPMLTLKT
jgi:hypothetical protein